MKINGERYTYENMKVTELLEKFSINVETVIVEVNGLIVPKNEFGQFIVDRSATVELVAFVGGG